MRNGECGVQGSECGMIARYGVRPVNENLRIGLTQSHEVILDKQSRCKPFFVALWLRVMTGFWFSTRQAVTRGDNLLQLPD
jgi:hypothetical protein